VSQFLPPEIGGGMPAEFYRFTLAGSSVGAWTSGSVRRHVHFGGLTVDYQPAPIRHEAIEASDERSAGGLRVTIPADDTITNSVADLFRGTTPTGVVHQGHAEVARVFFGDVASAEFSGSVCTLTVEPKAGAFKQRVLRQLYQAPCNNSLYDSFCGVVKANFSAAATVTAIASDNVTLTVPNAALQADPYYTGGQLQFGSRHGFIVSHVGSTLTLLRPIPGLAVSSSVTISAGCDRSAVTCQNKFSNIANHMGFPLIPNLDPFVQGVGKLTP
jgi:uncharacterized phage protein (TIGR02218 family)